MTSSLRIAAPWKSLVIAATLAGIFALATDAQATFEIPLLNIKDISLDEEQKQLEALLKQSGSDPYILSDLARIAYKRANEPLARKLWERASKQEPNISGAEVQLVYADIAGGQLDSAQKRLDLLKVAKTTDPHVVIAAGELAMTRKDFKTANELLMRALDMAPHYTATQLALGNFMEQTRQAETAKTFYEKATELQPKRAPGWLRLAALYFRSNQLDNAFSAYQKAEKCLGRQPLAETRMGEAYLARGDLYAAHQQFAAAIKRNQDDPFTKLRLAQTMQRVGRTDEARDHLKRLVATSEYTPALNALAVDAMQAGQWELAIELYRRAQKASPEDWTIANNLAILIVQADGSAEESMAMLKLAAKLAPDSVKSMVGTQGCVLWHAGRMKQAEPLLKQAVESVPNYPWTRFCYGHVLLSQNRNAEAKEQFEACQFLDAKFPRQDEVKKILAKLGQ